MGNAWALYKDPVSNPNPEKPPSFDPLHGFANRKPREMIATPEEMEAAKLPLRDRDYCAHLLIKFRACRADVAPWFYKCGHEKHEYLTCEYDDYILRMKEFERERRLRQRRERNGGSSEDEES